MNPNLIRAFLAGFLATVVITFMMYFVTPRLTGEPMDIAATFARVLGGSWDAGLIAHFVVGTLLLPALYALFLYPALEGGPAERGLGWGLFLWMVSQAVFMPMMGDGFFSSRAGGLKAAMASLLAHLAYGLVFGVLTGGPRAAPSRARRHLVTGLRARRAG